MEAASIVAGKSVEPFFREITVLANEVKKVAFKLQGGDVFLAVGKNLLESLSEKGPQTVPALAESRSSSRQNVQIMVNRLIRLGCVEMRPNPEHKKSNLVCLTQAGQNALLKTMAEEKRLFEKVSAHCSEKELQRGLDLITRLRKALEAAEEQGETSISSRLPTVRDISDRKQQRTLKHAPPESILNPIAEETEVEDNSLPYNLL